ncbi:Unknown protein, partial [Striga hermonthica]
AQLRKCRRTQCPAAPEHPSSAHDTHASAQRRVCDASVARQSRRLCPVAASMHERPVHAQFIPSGADSFMPRPGQAAPVPAAFAGWLAEPAADRPTTAGQRSSQTATRPVQT